MEKTKVEVIAFTTKGKNALKIVQEDERAYREKLLKAPLPIRMAYNKPTKEFIKNKNTVFTDDRHTFYRSIKNEKYRTAIYQNIKLAIIENGCTLDDFGVRFNGE